MKNTEITSPNNSNKVSGSNESLMQTNVISQVKDILGDNFDEIIVKQNVYLSSALYLIYWYHRTQNNPSKQAEMLENISEYFGENNMSEITKLLESEEIKKEASAHVEGNVLIQPTIDIVIQKNDQILSLQRNIFPAGPALIGGFILDEDEDNNLDLNPKVFGALRIAGEKIIEGDVTYWKSDTHYCVSNIDRTLTVKLDIKSTQGYSYKDKVTRMVQPSDPRHMVDTTGFKMELEGNLDNPNLNWIDQNDILDLEHNKGGFAFGHHRQIVSELTKEKDQVNLSQIDHHNWIRSIINNPLESYNAMKSRFEENNNHPETSCPELMPVVTKMINDLYSKNINTLCANNEFMLGQRYLVENALKHCLTNSNKICPYRSTIRSMIDCIKFFDVLVRMQEDAYKNWSSETYNSPNPSKHKYAYFFNHKYKNHLDDLLAKFPDEIIIPTYEGFSADDMVDVRHIPLRFVGLSNDMLYVDEFWQTPLEFLNHDGDHSIRMAYEDEKYCRENNMSRQEYIEASDKFKKDYKEKLIIKNTDTIEQKEIKKLKRVIIFEITHEDSKPYMRDVIINSILTEEGLDIHREAIVTDPETGYLTREKTVETQGGISPLAFLIHKLQHGFFDQVDNQNIKVVSPEYRKAEYVAQAAYEILQDLDFKSLPGINQELASQVSYEWLLKRTCSKSPYKVHNKDFQDPSIATHGDGTRVDI